MILLVTGGSGCGKSFWAERVMARLPGPRVYLATMACADEESRRRVARHRAQRAHLDFETVERPTDLGGVRIPPEAAVLLEDLPNLLANEMFAGGDPGRIAPQLEALADCVAEVVYSVPVAVRGVLPCV